MNKKRYLHAASALLLCALILVGCTVKSQPAMQAATAQPTDSPIATETPAVPSPTPIDNPNTSRTAAPIKGLVLVAPVLVENVETVSIADREDGAYREELLFDGMVSIVNERLTSVEFSEEAIAKQMTSLNGVELSDIKIEQADKVSKRLSYPAWQISYITGSNEDTRKNLDIYIQSDEWDYRFHTSTPIDAYEEYSESIESWIESLDLFESK